MTVITLLLQSQSGFQTFRICISILIFKKLGLCCFLLSNGMFLNPKDMKLHYGDLTDSTCLVKIDPSAGGRGWRARLEKGQEMGGRAWICRGRRGPASPPPPFPRHAVGCEVLEIQLEPRGRGERSRFGGG